MKRWRLIDLLVAVLVAAAIAWTVHAILSEDDGQPAKPETVTGQTKQGPITAPITALQDAKTKAQDVGLGHETQTPQDEIASDKQASPRAPRIRGPTPLASSTQPGCTSRFNTHNYSFRNGVRPSTIWLHLTVAANRPGWGDINGVAIFLNRPATQASSNYIIDNEGHCLYTVPEVNKAWTQANLNPASACSFEVQNTGSEATYAGTAGLNKLARVVHDCAQRWHIPLQRASVSGSRVTRPGVLDHLHGGPAAGGHVDIRRFGAGCFNAGAPAPDTWRCVDLVIAKARALDRPAVTAHARGLCQRANRLRAINPRSSDQSRELALLKRVLAKKYVCRAGKNGAAGTITRR